MCSTDTVLGRGNLPRSVRQASSKVVTTLGLDTRGHGGSERLRTDPMPQKEGTVPRSPETHCILGCGVGQPGTWSCAGHLQRGGYVQSLVTPSPTPTPTESYVLWWPGLGSADRSCVPCVHCGFSLSHCLLCGILR